jgi:hypothetical protein
MPDKPESIGRKLRALALGLTAERVKAPVSPAGVYGVIMDWGLPNELATLVAIADGGTSLYAGGGGFLGGHAVPAIRQAGRQFLEKADDFVGEFPLATEHPTPQPGHVIFHILTADGVRTSPEIDTATLAPGDSGVSELFGAAQDVITQIRIAEPKK